MTQERSILAGGCFWGMQDLIRKRVGVISTRVGYSGGDVPNATYRRHGTHAEAIEIIFDPDRLSFRELLEFFFQVHDPTTRNRQGNDVGTSYRSAIFTHWFTRPSCVGRARHDLDCRGARVCSDHRAKIGAGSVLHPVRVVDAVVNCPVYRHEGNLFRHAAGKDPPRLLSHGRLIPTR